MSGIIITVVCGYLIGSISFGMIMSKLVKDIDIREYGSGNTGMTNVLRTLGKGPAAVVLVGDALKGIVGVLIGSYFEGTYLAMAGGVAAMAGHMYPLYHGFRGGKGAATGLGVILVLVPDLTLVGVIVFILVIAITRYVSLGTILGSLAVVISAIALHKPWPLCIFLLFIASLVIYRHRLNIVRIYQGKENKFSLGPK